MSKFNQIIISRNFIRVLLLLIGLLLSLSVYTIVIASSKEIPSLIRGITLPGSSINDSRTFLEIMRSVIASNLIKRLISWTAALAIISLIFGGYQYLTSIGETEKIKSAHKTIIWSLIGLTLTLLSFAIVQIIVSLNFKNTSINPVSPVYQTWVCQTWVCPI